MSGGGHPAPGASKREAQRCDYWRRTLRLTLGMLLLWAAATFLPVWFAPRMEGRHFLGWPLAYFLAAQASLMVFVAIVWGYAYWMDRLDRECLDEAGWSEPGREDEDGETGGGA